jgi:hypothetical protein
MPGIAAPDRFPIRDPRSPAMKNGRNWNPPRLMEVGGLSSTGKWNRETGNPQSPQTNIARLERVGGAKSSHSAKNSDDD